MSTSSPGAAQIDALLRPATFAVEPEKRANDLLAVLKSHLGVARERSPAFRNYVDAWPMDYRAATRIADLPYLPVSLFKSDPPLALVPRSEIVRTLASSSTTGQQPSRVVLDAQTARRMVKGVAVIMGDFIGPQRRPYLVIDTPENTLGAAELGARGAAIQGLRSFATELACCLRSGPGGVLSLDEARLEDFATRFRDVEVLVYGFTYVIWQHFIQPLRARGITLGMPRVRVLHSGGWKRLTEQAVTPAAFAETAAVIFGCTPERIVDFYGMVENVGVVYPDCGQRNKHVPAFADVIVRDPLTLEPVGAGEQGIVQVCSALPTSFPGFAVLTDDMAEVVHTDACPCGRRGLAFRFVKRVPRSEVRGCGNVETTRARPVMS
ncbi:MAG: acyl-protein synthetase [Proteobacteria bacterium]|nr:acyl-protein synthetase [Pseudomonadota bacterium]